MKTDAERMALIRQRTAQLQRQARARQMLLIDAGCMAACLALVVCLGLAMPGWAGTSQILLFVASEFIRDYTRFNLYYAVDILLTLTLVSFLPHILREEPHDLH